MKKLIALVLALVCVLALVGCNNNEDVKYDLPLMVMIDGVLYENTGEESIMFEIADSAGTNRGFNEIL